MQQSETMNREGGMSWWTFVLFAGAVAGASVEVAELAAVTRAVNVTDALVAAALAALVGAVTLLGLALIASATLFRRRGLATHDEGKLWAIGGAVAIALMFAGVAGVIHFGNEVRGGWRTLSIVFLGWCTVSALAAAQLSAWLARRLWDEKSSATRSTRIVLALPALLLAAAAASLARGGSAVGASACLVTGVVVVAMAPRVSRRVAATLAMALWLAAGMARWRPKPEPRGEPEEPPPGSVVLIVLDTTRADVFGAYGSTSGDTPVFDHLARNGLLYEELISTSPWTVPSHATFFTGLPPRVHDCWYGGRRWLVDDLQTLAETLAERGYDTAAFVGNEHLMASNLLQGFRVRESLGSPASRLALGRGMRRSGVGIREWIDRGASRAVHGVDAWLAGRRSRRPFFLFVNLFEAHGEYVSPISHHRWPEGVGELEALRVLQGYEELEWHALGRSQGREEEIVRAAYAAAIRYQDRMLGGLLEAIAKRYAIDRLPIVVTADHGENLGDGGRWGHTFGLNDALIRLPLVVRAPERSTPGVRVAGSFSSVDLPATVLDLAGEGKRFGAGRTLLGVREPEVQTIAEDYPFYVALRSLERGFASGLGDSRWPTSAVRSEGHKLVIWHGGPTRLYDLTSDPTESRDVLAQRPQLAARLLERYVAWSREVPRQHRASAAASAPLDPELAEQLRALGYL